MRQLIMLITIIFSTVLHSEESNYAFDLPKNPTKAALLSAFIPGSGQIYNEKYLKASGVAATQGYLIYKTIDSNNNMQKYKKRRDDINEIDKKEYNHLKYIDYHDKRQSFIFWVGFSVLLSAMDAYVDAHLINFKDQKKKIDILFQDEIVLITFKF